MMKRLLSVLRNSFILSIIFILTVSLFISFGKAKVIFGESEEINGPIVLKYDRLAVTGDSYAGLFCHHELTRDFILDGYALPGRTVLENKKLMLDAMRGPDKLVFICIGVNDHYNGTNPEAFERNLRDVIEEGVKNDKIIFIDSFVKYLLVNVRPGDYNILTYDAIVRRLCEEYQNLYYIDVNDLATIDNALDDNIHFNKVFNDGMYSRLVKTIVNLDF